MQKIYKTKALTSIYRDAYDNIVGTKKDLDTPERLVVKKGSIGYICRLNKEEIEEYSVYSESESNITLVYIKNKSKEPSILFRDIKDAIDSDWFEIYELDGRRSMECLKLNY